MNSRTIRAGLHFVCIMNYVTKIKICCHQQTNYFFFLLSLLLFSLLPVMFGSPFPTVKEKKR